MYLDWDSGTWREMPLEWQQQMQEVFDEPESSAEDEVGDKMERFVHPETHVEYESSFEHGKRLFFDERTNSWQPIPASLEQHLPAMILAVSRVRRSIGTGLQASLLEQVL